MTKIKEVSDKHDNSVKSSDNNGSIKSTFTYTRVSKLTTHPPIGSSMLVTINKNRLLDM